MSALEARAAFRECARRFVAATKKSRDEVKIKRLDLEVLLAVCSVKLGGKMPGVQMPKLHPEQR